MRTDLENDLCLQQNESYGSVDTRISSKRVWGINVALPDLVSERDARLQAPADRPPLCTSIKMYHEDAPHRFSPGDLHCSPGFHPARRRAQCWPRHQSVGTKL